MISKKEKNFKTVLVQPSSHGSIQSLFTYIKAEGGIGKKPPLAILILGTYLKSQGFNNLACIDAQLDDLSPEATVDRIVEEKPDLVGFTAWTDFWFPVWETVQILLNQ